MNYELRIKNTLKKISPACRSLGAGRDFGFRISDFLSVSKKQKGFSLVELLVTIGIFGMITSIVFTNQSDFNSSIKLTNLAYEVALKVREAQTYGVSVREFGAGNFDLGYGVYFSQDSPTTFIFFGDFSGNYKYGPSTTETVDSLSIAGEFKMEKFCVINNSGLETCSSTSGTTKELNIVFKRPKQDAIISTNLGGGYKSARVILTSNAGGQRVVRVDSSGQIYVEQ
ncbi:hypothetical protein COW81_02665 [Candidatus Campbellbacteria bacterium CG22_combo_CG10-13_8_21_14_all_36_13]|uniref:General secretion pathway GspH domain-containing protein n=1 Tax=Candidatus Campbellbacteria bacterium CG22_combo_CG10-13_8_21_14_all_36_13 TaxID=1974529 RepID=A0A2H0DYD9_9BACT|nr:MAG: hypothetical protein COW81_02665 [Candidatus Campbellbacteria bacterium CG22_combo_CG10-13_8_21_14_all_36_13]